MAATRNTWQKIQAFIWLGLAVGCLFFALVFWAINDKREDLVEIEKVPETEVELQIQPEKVAAMSHLGALYDEVKPLDLGVRVATSGQHEAEFRGSKFIQDQQKNYSLELFRVSNEDVIKSFLRKQSNRKPFTYLRLSGEGIAEQYIVFYGNYRNDTEAKAALQTLEISLPQSVKPKVIRWDSFTEWVNDLGSDELVGNALYTVNLKIAAAPKVDELELQQRRLAAAREAELARQQQVQTTEVLRDTNGNVVERDAGQTNKPEQKSANSVQELIDPFN
jgi:hypothetical protein